MAKHLKVHACWKLAKTVRIVTPWFALRKVIQRANRRHLWTTSLTCSSASSLNSVKTISMTWHKASESQSVKKIEAGVTLWAKKIWVSNIRQSYHAPAVWQRRWHQVPRKRKSKLRRTQASYNLCLVNTQSTEPAALSTIVIQSRSATAWRQSLAIAVAKTLTLTTA